MPRKKQTESLIREVLDEDYLDLKVTSIQLSELVHHEPQFAEEISIDEVMSDEESATCELKISLSQREGDASTSHHEGFTLQGIGVGFVDAAYDALITHYAMEYPSLNTLHFASFDAKAELETSRRSGADAVCRVRLVVWNHDKDPFEFQGVGRSMAAVSLTVVIQAVEYFVNSEKAFIQVYRALSDARSRGRQDLVERFTAQLADLVKTTSYTEVINKIRQEVLTNLSSS
jgi:hypothetical protein